MSIRVRVTGSGDIADIIADDIKAMLLDLHGGLVLATPVDTGNARAGWTVDTDAGVIENNAEYIEALNNGHSNQAPAMFVEAEIDRATKLL